ncbi:MAG: hypothetical protein DSY82_09470 [Flavobacteriia bacterium]|nr:MAG: hypothetical protein DSY82_09470 [Flavobacteriia bacterium]
MNRKNLIDNLNSFSTAERSNRDKAAEFVLDHEELFPYLVKLTFEKEGRLSVKAAWILELVCIRKLSLIYPYLDFFSSHMKNISDESALRPLSKVISFITNDYYNIKNAEIQSKLSQTAKEQLTEVSFDCLIEDHKIAAQVFAMDSLYDLGKEFSWIHPELKQILLQNLPKGSKGYQSHAKKILKLI